jgi:hypothetical protein
VSQIRKIICCRVDDPTMGLESILTVAGPIDLLFVVYTIIRMTMLLFIIARKRLMFSITCESVDPTLDQVRSNWFLESGDLY